MDGIVDWLSQIETRWEKFDVINEESRVIDWFGLNHAPGLTRE